MAGIVDEITYLLSACGSLNTCELPKIAYACHLETNRQMFNDCHFKFGWEGPYSTDLWNVMAILENSTTFLQVKRPLDKVAVYSLTEAGKITAKEARSHLTTALGVDKLAHVATLIHILHNLRPKMLALPLVGALYCCIEYKMSSQTEQSLEDLLKADSILDRNIKRLRNIVQAFPEDSLTRKYAFASS